MRCGLVFGSAKRVGCALAGFAILAIVGGCGMQMPSIRSPFYLANNSTAPIQQRPLSGDDTYVPPNANYSPLSRTKAETRLPHQMTAGTIVVQRGETLYSIARRHSIAVDELADANGLETHEINAGQELDLPRYAQK